MSRLEKLQSEAVFEQKPAPRRRAFGDGDTRRRAGATRSTTVRPMVLENQITEVKDEIAKGLAHAYLSDSDDGLSSGEEWKEENDKAKLSDDSDSLSDDGSGSDVNGMNSDSESSIRSGETPMKPVQGQLFTRTFDSVVRSSKRVARSNQIESEAESDQKESEGDEIGSEETLTLNERRNFVVQESIETGSSAEESFPKDEQSVVGSERKLSRNETEVNQWDDGDELLEEDLPQSATKAVVSKIGNRLLSGVEADDSDDELENLFSNANAAPSNKVLSKVSSRTHVPFSPKVEVPKRRIQLEDSPLDVVESKTERPTKRWRLGSKVSPLDVIQGVVDEVSSEMAQELEEKGRFLFVPFLRSFAGEVRAEFDMYNALSDRYIETYRKTRQLTQDIQQKRSELARIQMQKLRANKTLNSQRAQLTKVQTTLRLKSKAEKYLSKLRQDTF